MELNIATLVRLIKEEVSLYEFEEKPTPEEAAQSLATTLAGYAGAGMNIDTIFADAKRIMANPADDSPANRDEKKWSDADHDKQEDIAQKLAKDNPDMPKDEKMAIAGAQVNREKRKRNK